MVAVLRRGLVVRRVKVACQFFPRTLLLVAYVQRRWLWHAILYHAEEEEEDFLQGQGIVKLEVLVGLDRRDGNVRLVLLHNADASIPQRPHGNVLTGPDHSPYGDVQTMRRRFSSGRGRCDVRTRLRPQSHVREYREEPGVIDPWVVGGEGRGVGYGL